MTHLSPTRVLSELDTRVAGPPRGRRTGRNAPLRRRVRVPGRARLRHAAVRGHAAGLHPDPGRGRRDQRPAGDPDRAAAARRPAHPVAAEIHRTPRPAPPCHGAFRTDALALARAPGAPRSEEPTSELQSLMRI